MKDDSQRAFREKIMDCFRTERAAALHKLFRAAHTMKGAARTVGVTIVEQMARALEGVLDAVEKGTLQPSRELFHACRQILEAIQVVQITYENGEITPPYQATQALMELEELWNPGIALQGINHDISQRQYS